MNFVERMVQVKTNFPQTLQHQKNEIWLNIKEIFLSQKNIGASPLQPRKKIFFFILSPFKKMFFKHSLGSNGIEQNCNKLQASYIFEL
jgi:hypothetical protein